MQMSFGIAGITFRLRDHPEIGQLRPTGCVTIVAEPTNKVDPNALAIMWQGNHIGYVPGPKSKTPTIQPTIRALMEKGETFHVEIERYGYRDGEDWNDEHRGVLSSVTLRLCTESDGTMVEHNGKTYRRISHFVKCFDPEGGDGLEKWMVNSFKTWDDYLAFMAKASADGTAMHEALERYFKANPAERTLAMPGLPGGLAKLVGSYEIEPLAYGGGNRMFDDDTGLCGEFDMLAKVSGAMLMMDWKSSKQVRLSQKLQVCWYAAVAGRDRGEPVGAMICAFRDGALAQWQATPEQVSTGYQIIRLLASAARGAAKL